MKEIPSLADALHSVFHEMAAAYESEPRSDTAVLSFTLTHGSERHPFRVTLRDGKLVVHAGEAPRADLTITADAKAWLDIAGRRLSPVVAALTGRFTYRGDIGILERLAVTNEHYDSVIPKLAPRDSISSVVAVSGSPRGRNGYTHLMLEQLMRPLENRADCDAFVLAEKDIRRCTGCCSCWTKTPGHCVIKDDVPAMLARHEKADLVIFAFPLYIFTVPGLLKDYMDRTLLLVHPDMARNNAKTHHPKRRPHPQRFIVLCQSGFPEREHFDAVRRTFDLYCERNDSSVLAYLFCPAGTDLFNNPTMHFEMVRKMTALARIGKRLSSAGRIDRAAVRDFSRALPPSQYTTWRRNASRFWHRRIDEQLPGY